MGGERGHVIKRKCNFDRVVKYLEIQECEASELFVYIIKSPPRFTVETFLHCG